MTTMIIMMMMVIEGLSPELGHWRTFACKSRAFQSVYVAIS